MSEVKVAANPDELAKTAAEWIIEQARKAVETNDRFSIALSGGSTPKALFSVLAKAPFRDQINWAKVHIFWSDERCVPPDDAESNYFMARETLLDHVPLIPDQIHRIRGEAKPAEAAIEYEQVLKAFAQNDSPRLDITLLGMGDDGHTASLFPHTAALDETKRWVIQNYVETKKIWRITFTTTAINAGANVVFLVAGSGKAERLRQVLLGPYQPHELPSQLVKPTNGNLIWMVDQAAAALLQNK